jgi:hypothetical protein
MSVISNYVTKMKTECSFEILRNFFDSAHCEAALGGTRYLKLVPQVLQTRA